MGELTPKQPEVLTMSPYVLHSAIKLMLRFYTPDEVLFLTQKEVVTEMLRIIEANARQDSDRL